jgi:23S rRNA pseudouridine1911/1915/1917 synthase
MAVVPRGRQAESHYETRESFPEHTLLLIRPKTGRTHQIRVHLAFVGTPIVGDSVYGRRKPSLEIERPFLHAHKLKISIQKGEPPMMFESPLPSDLEAILGKLRARE